MISKETIHNWLQEDIKEADITSEALIPKDFYSQADLILKEDGVLCGLEFIDDIFKAVDHNCKTTIFIKEGTFYPNKTLIAKIEGPYQALLKGERTMLNLIQHLSGISTATHQYVELVKHTRANILDTRKTTPGYRELEKYAVKVGGGMNHRIGLYDQFLIKENHIKYYKQEVNPFLAAIQAARAYDNSKNIIIEVETLEEFRMALKANPNVILLDNMSLTDMTQAVEECSASNNITQLEASGGICYDTVKKVAETGVHRISVGAITHSAKNLDISMLVNSNS